MENHYDTKRMAEIITVLLKEFGDDKLVSNMIEHLIRDESDKIVPKWKSEAAAALEKECKTSLEGLNRRSIYGKSKELSKKINIEHGLPIKKAIERCLKAEININNVKKILEEVRKGLVYIAKTEHGDIERKRKNGGNPYEDIGLLPNL